MEVLPGLFKQALEQLDPSMTQCVQKALQGKEEEAPVSLLELRQVRQERGREGCMLT